jgi:diguanylate cyclase (GGDEF)-like protein
MDPVTAFAIATFMMLLNGGVLGLVHGDLPESLRPSAKSWRIATLLIAGGCVLLAVQTYLPPAFVLPLANGLLLLGLAGYWHSLRQFYGQPARAALLVPPLLGAFGVYVFARHFPDLSIRVAIVTAAWAVLLGGSIHTLQRQAHADRAVSRRVLAAIFAVSLLFILVRGLLLPGLPVATIVDAGPWINLVTPIVASILPVIGTTAFLLLCSERIRRDWEHAASTDNLTGLANRRVLAGEGARLLREAQARSEALSVAVVDIDHFKQLNDSFGHDTGDVALRHVADCLRRACDDRHLPARQGGEEFVVLLPRARADAAQAAAERIRRAIESAPFVLREGQTRCITVSIGLATLQPGDRQFDDLLRRADRGLYAAKSAGRNRVAAEA